MIKLKDEELLSNLAAKETAILDIGKETTKLKSILTDLKNKLDAEIKRNESFIESQRLFNNLVGEKLSIITDDKRHFVYDHNASIKANKQVYTVVE